MTTRVAIVGASGKMGRLFSRLLEASPDYEVHAALTSRSDLSEMDGADLVVDVSTPAISPEVVAHALAAGANVLVGTSGWPREKLDALERTIPTGRGVLIIPNFSVGSALGTALSILASRFYESIEIIESHASAKIDSPSGTAVRTAELIDRARADLGPVEAPHVDQRARGELIAGIPVHSLRQRGIVAQQRVILGGPGETLTIAHDTIDQSAYEHGITLALARAQHVSGLVVGLENVIDLGLGGQA
ncbi:4-hydroxy-tetrahydrodipicolinate reductase [Mycetocola saprophilus]|uniref:4-hydroxy-tetrahydrodipicolinate reductase n=1 Tax=Mycetocola saprophilus TaxID=76636 RepID=UPI003BF24105